MNISEVHRQAVIIDGHCDTLLAVAAGRRSLLERSEEGHIDLPRLQEAGVTAQVFALYVPAPHATYAPTAYALRLIHHLYVAVEESGGALTLAREAADIECAHADGRVAAIIGMEGAEPLDGSLELLHIFHRLGLRLLGLTWNRRNAVADGLDAQRTNGGLTPFGVRLVEACHDLGIVIDVAHLAPRGVEEVLQIGTHPIVASHANARALCDHPRNLTDEQLQGIAERGGVVGATFVPQFISEDPEQATLDRFLDHIAHMVEVMGADHVALGSDFDGFDATPPEGITSVVSLPRVTEGLAARGFPPEVIRKILGENWLRVFRVTWK
ncbi:MAG TPA: membrane dipeptidase [Caldilineae bacterium]|nr:membrane dipeptidase [Caldilineae bacterium]